MVVGFNGFGLFEGLRFDGLYCLYGSHRRHRIKGEGLST